MSTEVQIPMFPRKHPHHTKVEFTRIKSTVQSLLTQGHDRHRIAKALNQLGFKKASGDPIDPGYVSQVRYKLLKEGPSGSEVLPPEEVWSPAPIRLVLFLAVLATVVGFIFKHAQ